LKYTVLAIILDVYVYVCICHSFGPIPFFFVFGTFCVSSPGRVFACRPGFSYWTV